MSRKQKPLCWVDDWPGLQGIGCSGSVIWGSGVTGRGWVLGWKAGIITYGMFTCWDEPGQIQLKKRLSSLMWNTDRWKHDTMKACEGLGRGRPGSAAEAGWSCAAAGSAAAAAWQSKTQDKFILTHIALYAASTHKRHTMWKCVTVIGASFKTQPKRLLRKLYI